MAARQRNRSSNATALSGHTPSGWINSVVGPAPATELSADPRSAGIGRRRQRRGPADSVMQRRQHQVEPNPAEVAGQCGSETSVLDWCERPVYFRRNSRAVSMMVTGTARQ